MPRLTPRVLLTSIIAAFVFVSFVLYSTVDSRANQREEIYEQNDREINRLRQKIKNLGDELKANDVVVDKLQQQLSQPPAIAMSDVDGRGGKVKIVHDVLEKNVITPAPDAKQILIPPAVSDAVCPATAVNYATASDIQMLAAYDVIPFDNQNGGVWKQGWEIKYDSNQILKEKKLEVIVVPHSHDDPGWLMTFEDYYSQEVHGILDNMLSYLTEHPDMKFIYAEMSFFELWWSNLPETSKKAVKKLLTNGQLEIVTGAWVMTDEANSHYYATIMEMIEGHEFLVNQLDYRPSSHWSIDPFGLSPTLSYVAKAGNLSHLAVQRVHYSVKKYLAQSKNLEFVWRQLWAGKDDHTDIITHMFPFYSYDVPHTCGPDPTICCQFDFRRAYQYSCPWGVPVKIINENNVVERARTIADQYRKKAQLYKTNVLLVPLGDDFRYGGKEFKAQHENYAKLFEQINADTTLNMHARFGTLKDYFSLLDKRRAEDPKGLEFPTLSGDFFTYADRDDHYWSGYFTSRPFYKHMDRSLGHYLRSADLAFSLANWKSETSETKWPGVSLYDRLVDARRALSLFQHHDGVTGTAKDPVVEDYGDKMVQALNWSKRIIASAAEYLLQFPVMRDAGLKVDEEHSVKELPVKAVVEDGGAIVVQNSLGHLRNEVVCVNVNSFKSRITKSDSEVVIAQQIEPVIGLAESGDRFIVDKDKFQLCFMASIPPFGFARYELMEVQDTATVATIESSATLDSSDFSTKIFGGNVIELSNDHVTAKFDTHTGFLTSVKTASISEDLPVDMSFVSYGARPHNRSFPAGGDSLSGAYLFLPNGEARPLSNAENAFVLVSGPVRKTVIIKGPKEIKLLQTVSLDFNAAHLDIRNLVDIRSQGNFEAAMRLKTGIIDGEQFYTELNGYQIIRRKRFAKLPLQAHFYPMPGAAFVENNHQRISLLGRQALGVASLRPGWIEVMLDRRLDQDDDRGLAQPVHDNRRTESVFRLVLESVNGAAPEADPNVGYHSLATSILSAQIHYPPVLLIGQLDHAASSEVASSVAGLARALPCDVHPVAVRTLSMPTKYGSSGERSTNPQNSAALVLQRFGVECRIQSKLPILCDNVDTNNKFALKGLFTDPLKNARAASLTLLYTDESAEVNEITLVPLELKSVKLNF